MRKTISFRASPKPTTPTPDPIAVEIESRSDLSKDDFPLFKKLMTAEDRAATDYEAAAVELMKLSGMQRVQEIFSAQRPDMVDHSLQTIVEIKCRIADGRTLEECLQKIEPSLIEKLQEGTFNLEELPEEEWQAFLRGFVGCYEYYINGADKQITALKAAGFPEYSGGLLIIESGMPGVNMSNIGHGIGTLLGWMRSQGKAPSIDYVLYYIMDRNIDTPHGQVPTLVIAIAEDDQSMAVANAVGEKLSIMQGHVVRCFQPGIKVVSQAASSETLPDGRVVALRGYVPTNIRWSLAADTEPNG